LVEYTPDAGSSSNSLNASTSSSGYTGKQIWVDLQDWKAYGIQYQNNQPISYMQPEELAEVGWEERALAYGHFTLNGMNELGVIGDCHDAHGDGQGGLILMDGIPCPDNVNGDGRSWLGNIFDGIGDFFGGFFDWLGGIFDGNGNGGNPPGGGGGNWGGGGSPGGPGGGGYGGGGWPGGGGGRVGP